eukprot:symbB.v1.2.018809.t1/scaffold1452.1/size117917/8
MFSEHAVLKTLLAIHVLVFGPVTRNHPRSDGSCHDGGCFGHLKQRRRQLAIRFFCGFAVNAVVRCARYFRHRRCRSAI